MEKIPPEKYVDIKMLSEISNVLDIRDKTILRYEMIREYEATTQTAEQVGRKYGYSRTRFHEFKQRFIDGEKTMESLGDKPYGPKEKSKLKPDVLDKIVEIREETGMSIHDIPDELERRHGIKLSYGSVNRALKKKALHRLKGGGRRGTKKKRK
ncbi:MAG: hypothetical protein COV98_05470 [Candidatus Altarchaeum sp. CG12_big_fil_rev_8_21_14_0_65_33_22]|nr:MAG: hypothetical protein AUK59_05510 [Candidatus Altarchaeum sp. CG2_30_32_3053]PIN66961.1 MAG: hypothetical protein COV98_05470 [Candidatus Altarchaeum sp. CG12_big_fil_rev_8_21_14_0_65_33_22]